MGANKNRIATDRIQTKTNGNETILRHKLETIGNENTAITIIITTVAAAAAAAESATDKDNFRKQYTHNMAFRPMISVLIAFEVCWFLLWTVGYHCLFLVPLGMVIASENVADIISPTKHERRHFGAASASLVDSDSAINRTASSADTAHQIDAALNHYHPQQQRQQREEQSFLLGVMVDAGRHEFSVDWIKAFMGHIHKMGFNTLHLTLANDQRFAFVTTNTTDGDAKKRTHGTTTKPTDARFATRDLKNLAKHARSLDNMTLLPEVSLPFFAASWAGSNSFLGGGDEKEGNDDHYQHSLLAPLPCPDYVCSVQRGIPISGTNLPLDIRHPRIRDILRSVLRTLVEGLNTPAYLHLGAVSSISTTNYGCWEEALRGSSGEESPPNYEVFENTLAEIVADDLGYRPRIIRSLGNSNGNPNVDAALGNEAILQYQDYRHTAKSEQSTASSGSYLLQPRELNLATTLLKDHPTGWAVYRETLNILRAHRTNYGEGSFVGMIVSTEALPPTWFEDRNIMGRLLAISMAFQKQQHEEENSSEKNSKTEAGVHTDQADFESAYRLLCNELFPSDSATHFCNRLGGLNIDGSLHSAADGTASEKNPDDADTRKILQQQTITEYNYKKDYSKMWNDWAKDICHRLTESREELQLQVPSTTIVQSIHEEAFSAHWRDLSEDTGSNVGHGEQDGASAAEKEAALESTPDRSLQESSFANEFFVHTKVPFRGFIVDMVDDIVPPEVLSDLMEQIMAPLGFNTLQLSLINHLGCSLQLESLEGLYHLVPTPPKVIKPLSDDVLRQIVDAGDRLGIELIPEISVTTQATGWYHAGFLINCPNALCLANSSGDSIVGGISNNVNHGSLLPLVLLVIQKLRTIFRSGSFLHLGSDERVASQACWAESGRAPDYNRFEQILSNLLEAKNWYNSSSILRWENEEGIVYPQRTGRITHYRYGRHSLPLDEKRQTTHREESESLVFGSLTITPEKDPWAIYQETRKWVSENDTPPRGLLAKIRFKDRATHPNRYKTGILAFAIGLSSKAPVLKDSSSLNAYISELCVSYNQHLCPSPFDEGVARNPQPISSPHGQMLCKAMTNTISRPVMRTRTRSSTSLALPSLIDESSSSSNVDETSR